MTVILVAEDEPRIASFVRRGLSGAGVTALFTTDGWRPTGSRRRGGIDLVLLDGTLPQLDGFEVLRRLRAAGSDVPVVMMLDRDALWDSVARLKVGRRLRRQTVLLRAPAGQDRAAARSPAG